MIKCYTWPTPNGHKVHIMLEETGLPYEVVPVNIRAGEQFQPEFLAVSPNNRIPAILDTDGPGGKPLSLFESGAILVYLASKSGRFLPKSDAAKFTTLQWVMFQMGGVGPMMGQAGHFTSNAAPERIRYAIERYTKEVARLHGVMEKQLAQHPYIAGREYTIADMAIWPWLRNSERLGIQWSEFPHVKAWFDRIAARPAVQRGIQVLAEHQSKPGHYDEKARAILFGKEQFERR
jgi:GST-like protein